MITVVRFCRNVPWWWRPFHCYYSLQLS